MPVSLSRLVARYGFIVTRAYEQGSMIVVNFRDPRLEEHVYFTSTVVYDRRTGRLEALVRSRVKGYKELYLEYCCEGGEMKCRPHVYVEDGLVVLSVEAKFSRDPISKFKRLLEELSPYT